MSNNVSDNLKSLFNELENFVTTKSVVGEPIEMNGLKIIPLVDVSFGVAAGAKEENKNENNGVGGLGAKVTPSAMLIIKEDGSSEIINLKKDDGMEKMIKMVPGIIDKFNIKKKKDKEE